MQVYMPSTCISFSSVRLYLGIFTVSSSILYFEIFATRILAVVHGSYFPLYTLAIAMLGLSAGGSFIASINSQRISRPAFWCALLCLSSAVVLLMTYRCTSILNDYAKGIAIPFAGEHGFQLLLTFIRRQGVLALVLGSLASAFYFFLGACLSLIFLTSPSSEYHRMYSVDLLGGAFGGALAVVLLEAFGFQLPLMASIVLPLIAGLFFSGMCGKRLFLFFAATAVLVMCFLAGGNVQRYFEPKSSLRILHLGIHGKDDKVTELWKKWTSYGRKIGR